MIENGFWGMMIAKEVDVCADYLEANATEDERKEGYDIADYLLKVKPDEAILQQMIRKNPVLKTLIDTFDLKFISVQQGTPRPKVLPPKKRGFRL